MLHHATGHAAHRHHAAHHYHPAASSVSAYQQQQHSFQQHQFPSQHQQVTGGQHLSVNSTSNQQHLQSQQAALTAALVDSSALVSPISMSPQFNAAAAAAAAAATGLDHQESAAFHCVPTSGGQVSQQQQLSGEQSCQQQAAAAAFAYQHQQEQQFVDHFMSMQQPAQHFATTSALHQQQVSQQQAAGQHLGAYSSAATSDLANLDNQHGPQIHLEHNGHLHQHATNSASSAIELNNQIGQQQQQHPEHQFQTSLNADGRHDSQEDIELEDFDTMSSSSHDELTGQRKKRGK